MRFYVLFDRLQCILAAYQTSHQDPPQVNKIATIRAVLPPLCLLVDSELELSYEYRKSALDPADPLQR